MTTDEMIAVLRAHKEGKKIQVLAQHTDMNWQDCDNPSWDFRLNFYRVKPEPRKPREWWAEIPIDGSVGQIFQHSSQITKCAELVRVREVLENEPQQFAEISPYIAEAIRRNQT